ncbi:MAG: tRNA uridine-5-carboxymethylaminomethyl(34) synthesis enzyme MnmG [Halobacteriovoraceae bacterium]|nr:tRNA uridine-5-carboxymethylaminomethyl(34) synthesis enzyme MnmG [Halobacteriovoraceae bacterium]
MEHSNFDIVVVGAGHAGLEAAYMASRFKDLEIAVITLPGVPIASAPCNPSIGGVGKGQVVREIDHLGGIMGKLADLAGIQYRTLNESKGYAVHSTRIQIDKEKYSDLAAQTLMSLENVTIIREKLLNCRKKDNLFFLKTTDQTVKGSKVIFTVGTFLNGKLHYGEKTIGGGRHQSDISGGMDDIFTNIKTNPKRFKTGTPPRILDSSIDFEKLDVQPSDKSVENMHVLHGTFDRFLPQKSCFLTYTNKKSMQVIRDNKEKSPMFNGQIKATGARYCPSIEDKAYRYPDKDIHHVFIEPEGLHTNTMYPSGISTSLPEEVQLEMVRSITGLETAKIEVQGYAVEYDVVDTTQLDLTLQMIEVPGLYFAGQVNGTSGYEEAAGQGLIAGLNAALSIQKRPSFILDRSHSYIGVMVEDLVSNLRDEPYRLFTARSENRLFIREDNTAQRMAPYRKQLDLNEPIDHYLENFQEAFKVFNDLIKSHLVDPTEVFYVEQGIEFSKKVSLEEILKLSHIDPVEFLKKYFIHIGMTLDSRLVRTLAISTKYSGYIAKADSANIKINKLEKKPIDWEALYSSDNISFECKQRIKSIKPTTFGQLRRIEGIRQATLSAVAGQYY